MATPLIYQIGKLADGDAVTFFSEIADATGFQVTSGRLASYSIDKERLATFPKSQLTHGISDLRIANDDSSFQIYLRRGVGARGSSSVNERIPSPYIDEIHIEITEKSQDGRGRFDPFAILETVEKVIQKWSPIDRIPVRQDGEVGIDITRLDDLVRLHKSLVSDAVGLRRSIDDELVKRRKDQDDEFVALKQALQAELEAERSKLAQVQAELDETRNSLDDRNHMHVRRELRRHISDEIASRVASDLVGRKSQFLNWLVTGFSLLCAAISGSYSAWQFLEFSRLDLANVSASIAYGECLPWALLIRGSISASVTAVFLALTLTWLRRTYLDNVKITHDLQRYSLDINRASWVIETIMEMTNKEGRVLPDRWIEGVCFGLFRSSESDRSEPSPLEAWGTLLNLSGRAEIGPGGPKIEFTNSRQTRKAAKGSDD